MKKLRLKRWVKVVLLILVLVVFGVQFMYKETKETPVGEYTCNGIFVKLCSGTEKVKKYME